MLINKILTEIYINPEIYKDIMKWRIYEDSNGFTIWHVAVELFERLQEQGY